MKSKRVFFIVLIVFALMAFAFHGSCVSGPIPYSSSGLNMAKYEGFKNRDSSLTYSSYSTGSSVPSQNPEDVENGYIKVRGFQGLLGSPDTGDRKDVFYGTEGSLDASSFGYSNSRGFLVLDDKQKQLLTTRGGNAVGNA